MTIPARWSTGCGCLLLLVATTTLPAREPDRVVNVWPGLAPGETTRELGTALPRRANEDPPATRVTGITQPVLQFFNPPAGPKNRAAVLILPGGGYNYVVEDKEGSEAADWLNRQGITGIVLRYRTKDKSPEPHWQRPLQDAQRALSLIRESADRLQLDAGRIGILGFSAGGQAAAVVATHFDERSYEPIDAIDRVSCRPDFAMLVYPWRLLDTQTGRLMSDVKITDRTPPTFLVHAHNDSSSSLGSVFFYAGLKEHGIAGELHIYENGGHGYGLRPVPGSQIHTWPDRCYLVAATWPDGRDS